MSVRLSGTAHPRDARRCESRAARSVLSHLLSFRVALRPSLALWSLRQPREYVCVLDGSPRQSTERESAAAWATGATSVTPREVAAAADCPALFVSRYSAA